MENNGNVISSIRNRRSFLKTGLAAGAVTVGTSLLTRGTAAHAQQTSAGANLTAGDTQVIGLGDPITLTAATGATGSVQLTLPNNYTAGMPVHLASAANPNGVSAAVATSGS